MATATSLVGLSRVRLLVSLLRAEGPRSLLRRLADRATERRWQARFAATANPGRLRAPVLVVLGTPPAARLGGVQIQLRRRLQAFEAAAQPYALLHPSTTARGGAWRLKAFDGKQAWSGGLTSGGGVGGLAGASGAWGPILQALQLTEATVLQLENAGDFLDASLGSALADQESGNGGAWGGLRPLSGCRLVTVVHDFGLYCFRPHLLERPRLEFCNYNRDLDRCTSCLSVGSLATKGALLARRERARALLLGADAVVFPSDFVRARHLELFPQLAARERVCRVLPPPVPAFAGQRAERAASSRLTVAAVGSVKPHKGSGVLRQLMAADRERGMRYTWLVLGGGDAEALVELRRLGARVEGYYRAGALAAELARLRVDVALVPSIWPETFAMTVDEAWSAGCPVVAFAVGAPGERIAARQGGVLVPLERGAGGLIAALDRLDAERDGLGELRRHLASREAAADVVAPWSQLYGELARLRQS